ncbi:hypothetical protein TMES_08570 [Thalassospira mesophila]|uniref:Uncharacterized protein n=1 Tax=Thalassospira mesophila TaxID=1293891 RepID=A0A1Y2L2N2_9PROT|nr:hypothetical protein TMES_08570 [Thalassospira mesophila]
MWRGLYKGLPGLASVFLQKNHNDLTGAVFCQKMIRRYLVLSGAKRVCGRDWHRQTAKTAIGHISGLF